MKIYIKYNKINNTFIIKINKYLFLTHRNKKYKKNKIINNLSILDYNYLIILKILRIFGLKRPLNNFRDFF